MKINNRKRLIQEKEAEIASLKASKNAQELGNKIHILETELEVQKKEYADLHIR